MARHLTYSDFKNIRSGAKTLQDYQNGLYATQANNMPSVAAKLIKKGIPLQQSDMSALTTEIPSLQPTNTAALLKQLNAAAKLSTVAVANPAGTTATSGATAETSQVLNTPESVAASIKKWQSEQQSGNNNTSAPTAQFTSDSGNNYSLNVSNQLQTGAKNTQLQNSVVEQYIRNLINQAESDNGGKAATREQVENLDRYGADLGNGVHVSNLLSQNTQENYVPGQTQDVSDTALSGANSVSSSKAVHSSSKSQIPVLEPTKQTTKQIETQTKKVNKQTTTAEQYAEQADRYQKRYEEYLAKAKQTNKADIKKKYLQIAESWKKDAEAARKKAGTAATAADSSAKKLDIMRTKVVAQEAGGKYRSTSFGNDYSQYLAATNNGQYAKGASKLNAIASASAKSAQAQAAKESQNYIPTLTQADAQALQSPKNKQNYVHRLTQEDAAKMQQENANLDTSTAAGYSQARINGLSKSQQNDIRQYMTTLESARNAAADEALETMSGNVGTNNSSDLNALAEQQKKELKQKYGFSNKDIKKYVQYMQTVDDAEENAQQQQEMYNETHTGNRLQGAYQGALNTVGAVAMSPYSTLASGIQAIGNLFDGRADQEAPVDAYAGGNRIQTTKQNAVAQTKNNIEQNLSDEGHPVLGRAVSTVYGVGENLAESALQYAVVNGALNDLGIQDAVTKALTRLGMGKAGTAALTDSAKRFVSLTAQAGANITTNQLADLLVSDAPSVLQNAANGEYQNAGQAAYALTEKQAESNMGNLFGSTLDALKGNGPEIPTLDTSNVAKRTVWGNEDIQRLNNEDTKRLFHTLESTGDGSFRIPEASVDLSNSPANIVRNREPFHIAEQSGSSGENAEYRANDNNLHLQEKDGSVGTTSITNIHKANDEEEFIPGHYENGNGVEPILQSENAAIYKRSGSKVLVNNGKNREDYEKFVDDSLNGNFGQDNYKYYYGKVSDELAKDLHDSLGIEIKDRDIMTDSSHIRHIIERHGEGGTGLDDSQIPVTSDDIKNLPEIFNKPDSISWAGGADSDGNRVFEIRKRIDGIWYVATGVRESKKGQGDLRIDSFRIMDNKKIRSQAADNAIMTDPDLTSETDLPLGNSRNSLTSGSLDESASGYEPSRIDAQDEFTQRSDNQTLSQSEEKVNQESIPGLENKNRSMADSEGIGNNSDVLTGEIPKLEKTDHKTDAQAQNNDAEFDKLGKGSPYDDDGGFDADKTTEMLLKYGDGKKRPGAQQAAEEDIPRGNEDAVNRLRETMANRKNPSNPEEYTGRTVTNSIRKTAMDTDEEYQKVMDTVSKHVAQTEKTSFEAADKYVSDDFDGAVSRYTAKIDKKTSGNYNATDIDGMFIARSKLNAMARETDDAALKEQYYQQSMQIAKNLDTIGHKSGQDLQAFAKWADSYDGAVTAVLGRQQNIIDKSINSATKEKLNDASKQIVEQFNALHKVNPAQEEVDKIVRDALDNCGISKKRISDTQVKEIAGQLLSQNSEILKNKDYDALNNQLEFMYSGVGEIKSDTLDRVYSLFDEAQKYDRNSKKYMDLTDQAYKTLAQDLNAHGTFQDKWDSWRYLSMLANPKTHIKNVTGNIMFRGVTGAKDAIAAGIEKAADMANKAAGGEGIQRTKSVLTVGDKKLADACERDATDHAWRQLSSSKYFDNPGNKIDENIPAWADKRLGKVLNKLSDLNSNLLEKEDDAALISKYKNALAGYLKANGYDESIFAAADDASRAVLDNARAYAVRAAKEATFHQDSQVSRILSNVVRSGKEGSGGAKALGAMVDYVLPFRKTPINILKSALEYSPLEFARVAADVGGFVGKTSAEKAELAPKLIDDLAKSLTGSGMMVAGALLAQEGILQVGADQSDSEQNFGTTTTGRTYPSINLGGVHINISEGTPSVSPLIYGATLMESTSDDKTAEGKFNALVTGLGSIADGLTDMTMLSSISDILNDVRYSDSKTDAVLTVLKDVASSAVGQMIPSLGRAIAKSIDSNRRSTYTDKSDTAGDIQQDVNYWKSNIPGLQQAGESMQKSEIPALQKVGEAVSNEPSIDAWGRERKNYGTDWGGTAGRIAQNFAIPFTITKDSADATDEELYRLHDASPDKSDDMFHSMSKTGDATFKGEDDQKITLTPKDWTKYQKENGQLTKQILDGFLKTDEYKALSDDDKITAIDDIYKYTKKATQADFGGKDLTVKKQLEMEDAYQKNGVQGIVDYLKGDAKESKINSDISNAGYDANDFTTGIYEKGGVKALDQYKDAQAAVKKYATDDNGLELNETTSGMYSALGETGIKDWAAVSEYSKNQSKAAKADKNDNIEWKQADQVKYLSTQKMNDRERGYMITALKGGVDNLAKDAQSAAKKGDYTSVWKYYKAKADGKSTSGTVSKDTSSGALLGTGSSFSRVATPTQNKSSSSSSGSGDKVNGITVSAAKYGRYQSAAKEIPSLDSSQNGYTKIYNSMDTDGNKHLKKSEVEAYIDALSGYTQSQKRALFNAYANSRWSNPY